LGVGTHARSATGRDELGDSAERESSRHCWGKDLTNWQMGQIWRESEKTQDFLAHPTTKL